MFHQKARQSVIQTDIEHFYQFAIEKLEDALDSNPTSKITLTTYAEILFDIQISKNNGNQVSYNNPEIQKINKYYELAIKYDPNVIIYFIFIFFYLFIFYLFIYFFFIFLFIYFIFYYFFLFLFLFSQNF